jgi:hypothetical protein
MKTLIIAQDLQAFRKWTRENLPIKEIDQLRAEYIVMKNGDSYLFVVGYQQLIGHRSGTARVLMLERWYQRPDHMELSAMVKDNFPNDWRDL